MGRFQLFGAGGKYHPAVPGLGHSDMFQYHCGDLLSAAKADHQCQQHNGQTEIEDLGPQNGAVALTYIFSGSSGS